MDGILREFSLGSWLHARVHVRIPCLSIFLNQWLSEHAKTKGWVRQVRFYMRFEKGPRLSLFDGHAEAGTGAGTSALERVTSGAAALCVSVVRVGEGTPRAALRAL